MDIRLKSLTLKNFKGIKDFTFTPDGRNTNVFGPNASGKSTLADAFFFLFFGKDSSDRKAFSLKTIDKTTGESLHGLEHTVEAILVVDDKPLTLKKTFSENWQKKRGQAEKQFTGHQTNYWLNEVPVKKKEFQATIDELIKEDLFKLITNPLYFPMQLDWKARRDILTAMTDNFTHLDVINSDPELKELATILDGKSPDNYKKILQEKIKKLNGEIENIPIRIDEANSSLDEEVDYTETEKELQEQKILLTELEEKLISASKIADAYREKQQELTRLHDELYTKKADLEKKANAGREKVTNELSDKQRTLLGINYNKTDLERSIENADATIKENQTKADRLREEWKEVNAQVFKEPAPDLFTCPTCGQGLPEEDKEKKITAARTKFNADKQAKIAQIQVRGKEHMALVDQTKTKLADLQDKLTKQEELKTQTEAEVNSLKAKLSEPQQPIDITTDPEVKALQEKITSLTAELQAPTEDTSSDLLTQKQIITTRIEELNSTLNNKEVRKKTLARIKELESEEREKAELMSNLEGQKYLLEKYEVAEANLLEASVNNRFKVVNFKLFKKQINGGIELTCEPLIDGVPYADANNAAKINAGLDIINTLTKHYGVSAPIWVDNAEAVTDLLPIDSQVIRLVVSAADEKLRVEVE